MKGMRKLIVIAALGIMVLCFNGSIASAYIINTGPGPNQVGWQLYNSPADTQFLAAEFTLAQIATITSIEGWIACLTGGQLIAAIYSDGGNIPGSVIHSTSFSINGDSSYPQATWHGAMGLNWVLAPATYWVSFEGPASGSALATMPNPSANPLGNEAFWNGTQWHSSNSLDIGVRIDGVQAPIPASFLLLGSGLLSLGGWKRFKKI